MKMETTLNLIIYSFSIFLMFVAFTVLPLEMTTLHQSEASIPWSHVARVVSAVLKRVKISVRQCHQHHIIAQRDKRHKSTPFATPLDKQQFWFKLFFGDVQNQIWSHIVVAHPIFNKFGLRFSLDHPVYWLLWGPLPPCLFYTQDPGPRQPSLKNLMRQERSLHFFWTLG